MTRRILTCVSGLVLAIGLSGCGGGDTEIPEGHSEDEIRQPTGNTQPAPGSGLGDAEKQEGR